MFVVRTPSHYLAVFGQFKSADHSFRSKQKSHFAWCVFLPFHRIDAISISFICKCYQISQTVISFTQIPRSWNISSKVLKGSQLHESSEWKGKRARCRSNRLVHDTSCSSTRASDQLSSDQCFREATSNVARHRAPSTSQVKPRGSHPLSSVNHS